MGTERSTDDGDLAGRVHVGVPRMDPGSMTTTQASELPDPQEGRDASTDFWHRNAGILWP